MAELISYFIYYLLRAASSISDGAATILAHQLQMLQQA
jgi:hypothetical protein